MYCVPTYVHVHNESYLIVKYCMYVVLYSWTSLVVAWVFVVFWNHFVLLSCMHACPTTYKVGEASTEGEWVWVKERERVLKGVYARLWKWNVCVCVCVCVWLLAGKSVWFVLKISLSLVVPGQEVSNCLAHCFGHFWHFWQWLAHLSVLPHCYLVHRLFVSTGWSL